MTAPVTNPDEQVLNIAGTQIDGGLADGEYLTAEPEANLYEKVVGTSGEVSTSKNLDRSVIVTLSLMETSEYNKVLTSLADLAKQSPGTLADFTFFYRDVNTGEQLSDGAARIWRTPSVSKDKTAKPRAWQIMLPDPDYGYRGTGA